MSNALADPLTLSPTAFYWIWGDPQIGPGVKDMAKDFVKGVAGGLKSIVKKRSLSEVLRGMKKGHPKRLRTN